MKRFTNSFSEETSTASPTGPHLKTPATAAGGVAMAGTDADASTSRTITEGLTEKAILFSFKLLSI
jgi:hypothetical protein